MSLLPGRARATLILLAGLLVLGELGLRLRDWAVGERSGSLYQLVVPVATRFKMRPGASVVVPERYGDITYRFNQAGYRDSDHAPHPGRPAIVLLGDSVGFGLGVQQEQTYAAELARQTGAEVVNLAMWAYDSCDELLALQEDGLGFAPRVVVVEFFMNDFAVAPGKGRASAATSLGERLLALKNRVLYSSNLCRRLTQGLGRAQYELFHDLRRRRFPETLNAAEPQDKLAYLAAHPDDAGIPAFACLAGIARASRAAGADVLVVASPAEPQLYDDRYDAIGGRLARFCQAREIAFVDALPALRASPPREQLFLDGVHLSALGHQRVASLLLRELARRLTVGD